MSHSFSNKDATFRRSRIFVVLVFALLTGCRSHHSAMKPSIYVDEVPVATVGGPSEMESIQGRVSNAKPGQQIVVYARSGVWWIQPLMNAPYTKIQPDGSWKNSTHLGTQYAALLVDSGYTPSSKLVDLPDLGKGVAAIAIVNGASGAHGTPKVIHFSGYDWTVRSAGSDRGGEPNAYDPENARIDKDGYLHLRMAQRNGQWTCAEVNLTRSLGYGTYRFVIQDSWHLRPSAVLGIFTWDESRSEGFRNELDIELSRWGDPNAKNAQYVIQPFYVPENLVRFTMPAGPVTYQFRWEPKGVSFNTFNGPSADSGATPINEHVFSSGTPMPRGETVHIDLYDFHHAEGGSQQPVEIVIEKFEYLP